MFALLKSEIRKLLTVRSTYILIAIALALTVLINYLGTSPTKYEEPVDQKIVQMTDEFGNEVSYPDPDVPVTYKTVVTRDLPKEELVMNLQESVPIIVIFVSIVLILLMAHEYRYNIINHTLTIANRRSKVLGAKILVGSMFTVLVTLLGIAVALGTSYLAIQVKDLNLPTQDYDWFYITLRHTVYSLGYALFCLGVAALVRNLTAGIAAAFVLPTIDSIAGFLMASRDLEPTKMLPFSALDRFGNVAADVGRTNADLAEKFNGMVSSQPATVVGSLAVFCAYFAGLWLVTWLLFLKRDAS